MKMRVNLMACDAVCRGSSVHHPCTTSVRLECVIDLVTKNHCYGVLVGSIADSERRALSTV